MRTLRLTLAILFLAWGTPAPAAAQSAPPNAFHPYEGGTNCIQVADSNGFFNCAPATTVDPATGNMRVSGNLVLGGTLAFSGLLGGQGGLAISPTGSSVPQILNGDFVIGKALTTTAPAGPGTGFVALRLRPSPTLPGYCRLVVSAGNGFVEYPLAIIPANAFLTAPVIAGLYDQVTPDIPGGPGGC